MVNNGETSAAASEDTLPGLQWGVFAAIQGAGPSASVLADPIEGRQ